ncbi:glycosyltransferase family 2 protein [Candidatus Woesearchaeota archaeon]|nr:glycosyltransferase family 2 protein [Candidatus Woesearchaeota archaeon]
MLSIILPSYNERESICRTIDEIIFVLNKAKLSFEIIVCDDNSPDETWKLIKDTYSSEKNVRVIRRMSEKGLSQAVIEGFSKAKGDYLFVLDADGQHDPSIIPKMFLELKKNDLVVGSRYVSGGGVGSWSKTRIFVSRCASYLAYPFMGKNKINDPMAGFFGLKKSLFNKLNLDVKGYKILLAIILASKRKLKIKEVPYVFRTRTAGESKLGFKVIFEYILMLMKFFISSNKELLTFAIVGFLGTIVNLLVMFLSVDIVHLPVLLSSAIAVEVSIIHNFLLNNFWTFTKRSISSSLFSRFLRFNFISLISLLITLVVVWLFTTYTSMWYLIAQAVGILLGFVINFLFNSRWVFKSE